MIKRTITLIMAWALLLTLCACGQDASGQAGNAEQMTWQEQYDLGVRYLSEGNYEEAIIAFTAAIEIDPKQAPAYVGRGDTYVALAERETDNAAALELWELAIVDYERAFGLGDSQTEKKLEESREILQQLQAEWDAQLLLEALYARFEENDIEGAEIMMRQTDYQELSASLSEGLYYYYDHYDHENDPGLAVYPNNFYYFGQWKNDLRSGQGLWIHVVSEELESYIYEGTWANDRPNGEGHIIQKWDPNQVQVEPGHITGIKIEVTGTFSDGLYHGTIYEVWHMNDGSVLVWSPITAANGIYQPMQNVPKEIRNRQYYQDSVSSGKYIVALDQEDQSTDLWYSGTLKAVSGFIGD